MMLALHRPRTHPPKAEITRLRRIVVKRVPARAAAPRVPVRLVRGHHARRRRQIHRIATIIRLQRPAERPAAPAVRSALVCGTVAPVRAQAQLMLVVVAVARRAVVGLVADMGVPGGVRVEGAEAAASATRAGGRALVGAGGGAVVVTALELGDLVAEPALEAASARGGAVGVVGVAAEGDAGREGRRG